MQLKFRRGELWSSCDPYPVRRFAAKHREARDMRAVKGFASGLGTSSWKEVFDMTIGLSNCTRERIVASLIQQSERALEEPQSRPTLATMRRMHYFDTHSLCSAVSFLFHTSGPCTTTHLLSSPCLTLNFGSNSPPSLFNVPAYVRAGASLDKRALVRTISERLQSVCTPHRDRRPAFAPCSIGSTRARAETGPYCRRGSPGAIAPRKKQRA